MIPVLSTFLPTKHGLNDYKTCLSPKTLNRTYKALRLNEKGKKEVKGRYPRFECLETKS